MVECMPDKRVNSKANGCLLGMIVLVGLLIIAALLVPQLIISRAENRFGPGSAELSSKQKLYFSTLVLAQSRDLTEPVDLNGGDVDLTIEPGESVPSIAKKLWQAGLIPNQAAFRNYLLYTGMDTSLKAATFTLSPAMSPVEIALAIQSSVTADVTLSILPGWRIEEIANSLPTSGYSITPAEFISSTSTIPDGYSFTSCITGGSLEGYLYPGSYILPRETGINELLSQILMAFETQVTPELRNGFTAHGLDLCQAVTLASIVEREAMQEDEMPFIASVFYNRLRNGAVLASDPTVQYALGYNPAQATWWTNPLSVQDLQVDSPYNTYVYVGLPPGPIASPGPAALRAVAFPAQSPYYYFRAACDGSGRHLFAETYEEHVSNACP
ncbi:MAG: endolytic transglycosylase MltG [Anaerolineales bacterium]|nr:endolytic transglycosylase MltG [Anaerolineae bacterium]PWB54916.1 MAG: endolytic transglycosylase MltG [Anaerolineales bacterium]